MERLTIPGLPSWVGLVLLVAIGVLLLAFLAMPFAVRREVAARGGGGRLADLRGELRAVLRQPGLAPPRAAVVEEEWVSPPGRRARPWNRRSASPRRCRPGAAHRAQPGPRRAAAGLARPRRVARGLTTPRAAEARAGRTAEPRSRSRRRRMPRRHPLHAGLLRGLGAGRGSCRHDETRSRQKPVPAAPQTAAKSHSRPKRPQIPPAFEFTAEPCR